VSFPVEPTLEVSSSDDARIAVFDVLTPGQRVRGASPVTPLLLVHGTGSDHTTWRVTGPLLAIGRPVYAMDRRGRGASGDGERYAAIREIDDVAAVAGALAGRHGRPIAVLGHSLGGRFALGAGITGGMIAAVVAYEGAPGVDGDPSAEAQEVLLARLREDAVRGDADAALARFLADGAGLPASELAAFRASPLWTERLATVPTIVRELDAALHDPGIGADGLARVAVPVLQLVGSASPPWFRAGAEALDARLSRGRLELIDGARHGAHHTHAAAVANAVEAFLDR
jgi:pimeloyl-ACP methyl ester carboxylesterase